MKKILNARELFFRYDGSYFHMIREDVFKTYKEYNVPLIVEHYWCNELLQNILSQISIDTKNQAIGKGVSRYCSILCNRGNYRKIDPIINYILKHAKTLDTFTLCLSIESVFEVVVEMQKSVYYRKKCSSISSLMICVLETNIKRGIIVSNEYILEENLHEYLSEDSLKSRILADIDKWRSLQSNTSDG